MNLFSSIIFSRLFLLVCSTLELPSTIVYTRLFDVGYFYSKDILLSSLSFVQRHCPNVLHANSSNHLLHRTLFELFPNETKQPVLDFLQALMIDYLSSRCDREDLIRSCILICRHQTWNWCTTEFLSKLLFPLVQRVDHRSTILTLLQYVLVAFTESDQFRNDSIFHNQMKNFLLSIDSITDDDCNVRDRIFAIIHTCT